LTGTKPNVDDYRIFLGDPKKTIVTLHGWMRIIPAEICEEYEIYNGHPGLITKYPELKGKDPQEKAFNLKLSHSGCVIHRVTNIIDDGEILKARQIDIEGLTLDEVYERLHDTSIDLWCEFIKEIL